MKLDWKSVGLIVGGVLLIYFTTRRDMSNLTSGLTSLFRPTVGGTRAELTGTAQERMQKAVDLGYARWIGGVFTLTPAGESFIAQGGVL